MSHLLDYGTNVPYGLEMKGTLNTGYSAFGPENRDFAFYFRKLAAILDCGMIDAKYPANAINAGLWANNKFNCALGEALV